MKQEPTVAFGEEKNGAMDVIVNGEPMGFVKWNGMSYTWTSQAGSVFLDETKRKTINNIKDMLGGERICPHANLVYALFMSRENAE